MPMARTAETPTDGGGPIPLDPDRHDHEHTD